MGHRHCASYQRTVGQTEGGGTTVPSHRDGGECSRRLCYFVHGFHPRQRYSEV